MLPIDCRAPGGIPDARARPLAPSEICTFATVSYVSLFTAKFLYLIYIILRLPEAPQNLSRSIVQLPEAL